MKDLAKQLGQRIKDYRKSKNLKQSELAEKIGVEPKYLSRLETGLSTPSFKTIEKIADAFNIEVSALFDFDEEETEEAMKQKLHLKIENYSIMRLKMLMSFSKIIDKNFINI